MKRRWRRRRRRKKKRKRKNGGVERKRERRERHCDPSERKNQIPAHVPSARARIDLIPYFLYFSLFFFFFFFFIIIIIFFFFFFFVIFYSFFLSFLFSHQKLPIQCNIQLVSIFTGMVPR